MRWERRWGKLRGAEAGSSAEAFLIGVGRKSAENIRWIFRTHQLSLKVGACYRLRIFGQTPEGEDHDPGAQDNEIFGVEHGAALECEDRKTRRYSHEKDQYRKEYDSRYLHCNTQMTPYRGTVRTFFSKLFLLNLHRVGRYRHRAVEDTPCLDHHDAGCVLQDTEELI